ncbi:MAG: class I adenylate-forming enzyme family protein, partial [Ilumatobacteraceae bacterium]
MNLAHIIDEHPGDHIALVSRSRATTYAALRDQVAHLRGGLASLGVGPGDRVALLCGNGRYFVLSYLATIGIGAVAVPLNPSSPAPEIEREIATVGASVVVVEPAAAQAWRAIDRATIASVRSVVTTEGVTIDGAVDLGSLLEVEPVPVVEVEPDALAALMFTSGTAGSPRAAMLSHGNLLANLEQGTSANVQIEPADVVYGVLPLFHIFGLNVVLGLTLASGAALVLVQRSDPSTARASFRARTVPVVPGAPPLWLAFSHFDEAPADRFAPVRLGLPGAGQLPVEALRRLKVRFG